MELTEAEFKRILAQRKLLDEAEDKRKLHSEIQAHIEAYLSTGKQIEVLPPAEESS